MLVPTQMQTTSGAWRNCSSPFWMRHSRCCVLSPLMPNARAPYWLNVSSNTCGRAGDAVNACEPAPGLKRV